VSSVRPPDPVEQLDPELLLQSANLPRQRRLADLEVVRRARKPLVIRDGDEVAQVPQLHARTLYHEGID
jgi:hypothetical protein